MWVKLDDLKNVEKTDEWLLAVQRRIPSTPKNSSGTSCGRDGLGGERHQALEIGVCKWMLPSEL